MSTVEMLNDEELSAVSGGMESQPTAAEDLVNQMKEKIGNTVREKESPTYTPVIKIKI